MHPRYISVSFSSFVAISTVPSLAYHITIIIATLHLIPKPPEDSANLPLPETSLDSPAHAQPPLTYPRTPYIHPIPVNHMPLPTIETLLSYTSLPQGHYESLVNGTSRVATSTCSSASTPTRARTDSASSIASDGSEEKWYDSVEGGEESAAWGEPEGARELQGTVVYGAAGVAVSPRAMRRERREVMFCGGRELGRIEETEEEHRWLKLL